MRNVTQVDLLPPLALLLLNGGVCAALILRRRDLPLPGPALACAIAPAIYAVGVIVALLQGSPTLPWRPGLAAAGLGTFAIPVALAATVASRRACALLAALAALSWAAVWLPPLWPKGWEGRGQELTFVGYALVAAGVSLHGLRRGAGGGLGRRVHVLALPLLAVGTVWVLLKAPESRRPVFSTSLLVAAEVALLALVEGRLAPAARGRLLGALHVLLLGLGAFLALVVAMNLGLFPRAVLPALVAAGVAAATAASYAALRPQLEAWFQEALYPEARAAERRIAALQAELAATRARLREAEHLSLVGQLAAEVAHEIKNPLGPIRGYARIIEREHERLGIESEVAARGIGVIREEVEAIDARARALLDLARPPRPAPEPLELDRLVGDVLELARGDWPAAVGLQLEEPGLPSSAWSIESDRLLLRSALLNTIQNAAAACGGQGAVRVRLVAGDDAHQVQVEDDGPGLPAGLAAGGPFRPFASGRPGGNGLGLVIAQGALRALGGELTLATRGPDGGALAALRIPRRPLPEVSEPAATPAATEVAASPPAETPAAEIEPARTPADSPVEVRT